jgi:adenine C2-methylase RlmN of 23S rRNA A2503 and tRNA A37
MGPLPHIHKGKNKASQMKEFKLFSNLPQELRILVWQFASQEIRVITVKNSSQTTREEDLKATHDAKTVPSILHTYQESRAISQNYTSARTYFIWCYLILGT